MLGIAAVLLGQFLVAGSEPGLDLRGSPDASGGVSCGTTLACRLASQLASNAGSEPSAELTVTSPNVTNLAGTPTPFSAVGPTGSSFSNFTWQFGDGTSVQTYNGTTSHTYANPGIYLVYVRASASGGESASNANSLLRHTEVASAANDTLGNLPFLAGQVTGNDSTNVNASSVIAPGGSVSVSNWIVRDPTDPEWTLGTPGYSVQPSAGTTFSGSLLNLSGLSGITVGFSTHAANGSYALTFSVPISADLSGQMQTGWSNFTFTIFVQQGGFVATPTVPVSPHPGTLVVYSNASYVTEDPQLSYDGPDFGLLQNVYQSLLFPNTSQTGPNPTDFVPDLATCVPGTSLCSSLYGSYASSFQTSDSFTFVLNPSDSFYDPADGSHASVWPNDVAFSVARDCLNAQLFSSFFGPGWILCQALIPGGETPGPLAPNQSWDNGLHDYYNNTPGNILGSMAINDSSICPALSPMRDGVHGNGCITFFTNETQAPWPEFLTLIAGDSGDWIGSCDWFASEGLGLPGWTSGSSCYAAPPGSAGNPNPTPAATAWDSYLVAEVENWTSSPVRWIADGSGPYYLRDLNVSDGNLSSYALAANPYWGGTTCVGGPLSGCLPASVAASGRPTYIANVSVLNELTSGSSEGLNALRTGHADLIDLDSTDVGAAVTAMASGQLSIASIPTLTINFFPFVLNYSVAAAATILGSTPTLPATALQNVDLRQFLIHAFPDQSQNRQACLLSGVQFCFQYGGVLPEGLTGYYPQNITWQFTDPNPDASTVGSAGWWWSQVENDTNISSVCRASTPCTFPVPNPTFEGSTVGGFFSDPGLAETLWAAEVRNLSGGALDPIVVPVTLSQFARVADGPGQNPFPTYTYEFSWAPDYPDPSDYLNSFLPEYSTYGYLDDVGPSLLQPAYEHPCQGPAGDPVVTTSCQGTAYAAMILLLGQGDTCTPPACSSAQRALDYEMVDQIATNLGLFVPRSQLNDVGAIAPWIDPTSIVDDPIFGSAATFEGQPFFDVRYLSVVPPVYPLEVGTPDAASAAPDSAAPAVAVRPATIPEIETGEAILFLVSVTGGTGVYRFSWNDLPTGCTSTNDAAITCTPDGVGTFDLEVNVTDSRGDHGSSPVLPITVVQGPEVTSFSVSPNPITLGNATTFTVVDSGGIGGLRLSYAGLPPGCDGGNVTSLVCTPTQNGSFTSVVFATDSIGVVALANTTLVVEAATIHTPPPPTTVTTSGGPNEWELLEVGALGLAAGLVVATTVAWWVWKRPRPPP